MSITLLDNESSPPIVDGTPAASLLLESYSPAQTEQALALWRDLERRAGEVALVCSSDWTEVWLKAYGDLVQHRFLVARRPGEMRVVTGICLLCEGNRQYDGPVAVKSLHLGTAGEPAADSVCVEYNDVCCLPEARDAFCLSVMNHMSQQVCFDEWVLDGIEADGALFEAAAPHATHRSAQADHYFDLRECRETRRSVLETFRSATRRKVKRNLEAMPDAELEWADSLPAAADVFSEMVELHQARWQAAGQPGSYASRRFRHFHEGLLARLIPAGKMALVRVRSSAGTVGCVQLLLDRNRALVYQCGWQPATGQVSPGVVVDYLAMEECLRRGFDAYDFLAFENQHKRLLSNRSGQLVWARHRRPALKFAVLDQARKLKQWLRARRHGRPAGDAADEQEQPATTADRSAVN